MVEIMLLSVIIYTGVGPLDSIELTEALNHQIFAGSMDLL